MPSAQPGIRPARSAPKVAIFFIYLLIIYPACPQGQKSGGPTCTGRRFLLCVFYLAIQIIDHRYHPDIHAILGGSLYGRRLIPHLLQNLVH